MKRFIIITVLIFLVSTFAYADTVLYRVSSGEVLGISSTHDFEPMLSDGSLATSEVSTFTDGKDFRAPDDDGSYRVFGYAKIVDGTAVRNATQIEIDSFAAAEVTDKGLIRVNTAKAFFANNPEFRMILKAVIKEIVDQINVLRVREGLSTITYSQAITAILERINQND